MKIQEDDIKALIAKGEGVDLEFKSILPPSKNLAQIMCAFANTKGGHILLGVKELSENEANIIGLSSDFNVNAIVKKAAGMLIPQVNIEFGYTIYIIYVYKSANPLSLDGIVYKREDKRITYNKKSIGNKIIQKQSLKEVSLELNAQQGTVARKSFVKHYQSIINVLNALEKEDVFKDEEREILLRVLFSSCADNFETYMSDLLFEIYLANPQTLKSQEQVTVNEVLNCSDLDDFIVMYARKKISKLQRGSVKAFLNENKQISILNAISENEQKEVEKILQIRHLYSHRNGLVDEKFQQYFPETILGRRYNLDIDQIAEKLKTLICVVNNIDKSAITKYSLSIDFE